MEGKGCTSTKPCGALHLPNVHVGACGLSQIDVGACGDHVQLGMDCTVTDPQERPSMLKVLERLRRGRSSFRGLLTCYLL